MSATQYLSRAAELEAKNPNSRAAALYRLLAKLRGHSEVDDLADEYRQRLAEMASDQALMRFIEMCRHGATPLNEGDGSVDRIRGWVDIGLSEEGWDEARKLARKIAKDPPDYIVCSDLSRAHDTAKVIAEYSDVPIVEVSRGFRPWNVGHFTGELSDVVVPKLREYLERAPEEVIPGGESFCEFRDRFFSHLRDASRRYPTGRIMVVAHHRNERLMFGAQAADWPSDWNVDVDVFCEKGEKTGTCQTLKVPIAFLEAR